MKYQDHLLLEEAYDLIVEGYSYKIGTPEKNNISKILAKYGLDGNGRFGNPSKGVSALAKALDEAGFHLGMVSGDILLGDEGSRLLTYHKYSDSTKEFEEHPEVSNSRIAFNWTKLGTDKEGNPVFEIQTYPS